MQCGNLSYQLHLLHTSHNLMANIKLTITSDVKTCLNRQKITSFFICNSEILPQNKTEHFVVSLEEWDFLLYSQC